MKPGAVTFVIFDGYETLDLTGPFEVFGEAGYELQVVAPKRAGPLEQGPVRAGGTVGPDGGSAAHRDLGGGGRRRRVHGAVRPHAGRLGSRRRGRSRVASVCSGPFLLAEAGLLDGRRVTTHWRAAERLAREYPDVTVDADPIYVQDGRFWTSAGITAGMDLALALVEVDLGPRPRWTSPGS